MAKLTSSSIPRAAIRTMEKDLAGVVFAQIAKDIKPTFRFDLVHFRSIYRLNSKD